MFNLALNNVLNVHISVLEIYANRCIFNYIMYHLHT